MPDRNLAHLSAGQPRRPGPGQLEGDLGSRVARPDHEGTALLQLRGALVLTGVELDDARVELRGEVRNTRGPVRAGRNHHAVCLEPPVAGDNDESVAVFEESLDSYARPDGELEPCRVGLEVVRHLVLR